MGSYLNPGSELFQMSRASEIYVDKSGLIDQMNRCLKTQQMRKSIHCRNICVLVVRADLENPWHLICCLRIMEDRRLQKHYFQI